ncbi:hypothetical protein MSM1_09350 [Mycobacterium sp. SM1]|uniref:hypothetical protein n=1 Tax=Mycobacterium sp. SM1 TaxID=2816243 RepID=UPI001BCB964C|nr:hypothetical protein [Mycobacterium sp. SM1]MBS4728536.1 hypothetical protein [Mycobacterium sp. SM1]
MRDFEVIDSELRLLAAVRRTARELSGCRPSSALLDDLLDERLARSGWASQWAKSGVVVYEFARCVTLRVGV